MKIVSAHIGTFPVSLKLLTTRSEQAVGFQNVREPSEDMGLLFVYPEVGSKSFHMRNVSFDIDLICLNINQDIIDIIRMESESDKIYTTPSSKNIIEMPSSWSGSPIVGIGDSVKIIGFKK